MSGAIPSILKFLDEHVTGKELQRLSSADNANESLRILLSIANLALYSDGHMRGLLLHIWRLVASRVFANFTEPRELPTTLATEIHRLATSRHDRSAGSWADGVVSAHLAHFLGKASEPDTLQRVRAFNQIFWYRLSPPRRFQIAPGEGATQCPICGSWMPEKRDIISSYMSRETFDEVERDGGRGVKEGWAEMEDFVFDLEG